MCRFSPDGERIAVGSDDACVDIYSTSNLARVGYCRGIPSYVTHIDWSQDGNYLQVSGWGIRIEREGTTTQSVLPTTVSCTNLHNNYQPPP